MLQTFLFQFDKPTSAQTTVAAEVPVAAGASATIIGLSIGIPTSAILIIVGSVILFGQIKKQMKKRKEAKKRKEEEQKVYLVFCWQHKYQSILIPILTKRILKLIFHHIFLRF